jgi:Tfp pilus assembly protein PilN
MPNINLIAARRSEKKRLERNTRQLFFGLTAEVAALVLLGSYIGARQITLRGALSTADAKLVQLQPTLDRIAEIEKETSALKPKLETLQTAKEDTLRWRAMLQIVAQSVPNNAWLSGITSTSIADDTTISLTGTAGSQTLVGETMSRLGAYPVFEKVDLHYTQLLASNQKDDTTQRISFEIAAHLKPTHPAAPPAGDGKTQTAKGDSNGKPSA